MSFPSLYTGHCIVESSKDNLGFWTQVEDPILPIALILSLLNISCKRYNILETVKMRCSSIAQVENCEYEL